MRNDFYLDYGTSDQRFSILRQRGALRGSGLYSSFREPIHARYRLGERRCAAESRPRDLQPILRLNRWDARYCADPIPRNSSSPWSMLASSSPIPVQRCGGCGLCRSTGDDRPGRRMFSSDRSLPLTARDRARRHPGVPVTSTTAMSGKRWLALMLDRSPRCKDARLAARGLPRVELGERYRTSIEDHADSLTQPCPSTQPTAVPPARSTSSSSSGRSAVRSPSPRSAMSMVSG